MDIIKEFPVIHNHAYADFKDRNIKKNAWRKISELLDVEERECIKRYESIRTTFSRYVRKALGKSGTGRDEIHLDPKYEPKKCKQTQTTGTPKRKRTGFRHKNLLRPGKIVYLTCVCVCVCLIHKSVSKSHCSVGLLSTFWWFWW